MTPQQAKDILAVFRPGTDDERDPIFAEALALARTNSELKKWLAESLAFDQAMKTGLASLPAPTNVRDAILAEQKIVRPVPWWQQKLTPLQWAAAAAIVVITAASVLWFGNRPTSFAEFRRDIADESWGPTPHVQVKVSSMAELRRSLDAQNVSARFTVPSTLAASGVRGYSLIHWRGHKVPVICYGAEGQHLHLVVAERSLFPDAPTSAPEMDRWQSWRTASWSRDDFAYVLTGLNTPTFVKKFRKSKRWDWEG